MVVKIMSHFCARCMDKLPENADCPKCGSNIQQTPGALRQKTVLNQRYAVGDTLGVGGFGVTYIGLDNTLESKVAIKEYMPQSNACRHVDGVNVTPYEDTKGDYDKRLSDFLTEAKRLAALEKCPGVVAVKDFFVENGTAYMVMPYLEGNTLKKYLNERGGSVPWPELSRIIMPIMDALTSVHNAGVVHRDLSPDNIYLPKDGQPLLIDFGAAAESTGDFTVAHDQIYKDGYAPPEQYQTKSRQGPWTDIYALAGTIYNGLTGKRPPKCYDRMDDGLDEIKEELSKVVDDDQLLALLKALQLDPKQRYQNVKDFKYDLLNDGKTRIESVGNDLDDSIIKKQSKKSPLLKVLLVGGLCMALLITAFFAIPHIKSLMQAAEPKVAVDQKALKELVGVTLDHVKLSGWHFFRAEKTRALIANMEGNKELDVHELLEIHKKKLADNMTGFEREFKYYLEETDKIRQYPAEVIGSVLDDAMSDHPNDLAYFEFIMMTKSQILGGKMDVGVWKKEVERISLKPGIFLN